MPTRRRRRHQFGTVSILRNQVEVYGWAWGTLSFTRVKFSINLVFQFSLIKLFKKQILFLGNGINFQPAWIDCQEFADLDYLDIDFNLQNLFQLHSRVLLHMALEKINLKNTMNFFQNRPFTFYINEHDCEVMTLYRLN